MKQVAKTSRRSFIGKFAIGGVGLAVSAPAAENIISLITNADGIVTNSPDKSEKKFVPVMITPFTKNLKLDPDSLSGLIDFYMEAGVKGFFANCLSSEMFHLDDEEKLALTTHVVKRVNGRMPVVASGSFGSSLQQKADFTKKMHQTGVNAVILITGHFAGKEEPEGKLIENFEKFFNLTGDIPVGTYECPSPYKRILTPEVFNYLLGTNRLIYHKDTTLDIEKIKSKLELAKNTRLELYDAHTPNAMYSLQLGAAGLSAIAGNFYPEILTWMCDNVLKPAKQMDVKWLQSELTRVDPIISKSYPMSAKYFLRKRGLSLDLVSRSSPSPLSAQQQKDLDEIYDVLPRWRERLGIVMNR